MYFLNIFRKEIIKKLYIFLISISIFSCGKEDKNESQSNKTETPKTETNKSAVNLSNDFIVDYDIEGKLKGKMVIYRNGEKLKQNMNTELMGLKTSNEVYIIDNNVYSIIEVGGKKMGNKTDLTSYNSKKKTAETITDFREFEKSLEGKKITGTENIIGYDCDIYEFSQDVFLSVYNKRYILKIKSPEFTATATVLNTNPKFSGNEFVIPDDVSFKTPDMKDLNMQKIDSLVEKYKK